MQKAGGGRGVHADDTITSLIIVNLLALHMAISYWRGRSGRHGGSCSVGASVVPQPGRIAFWVDMIALQVGICNSLTRSLQLTPHPYVPQEMHQIALMAGS